MGKTQSIINAVQKSGKLGIFYKNGEDALAQNILNEAVSAVSLVDHIHILSGELADIVFKKCLEDYAHNPEKTLRYVHRAFGEITKPVAFEINADKFKEAIVLVPANEKSVLLQDRPFAFFFGPMGQSQQKYQTLAMILARSKNEDMVHPNILDCTGHPEEKVHDMYTGCFELLHCAFQALDILKKPAVETGIERKTTQFPHTGRSKTGKLSPIHIYDIDPVELAKIERLSEEGHVIFGNGRKYDRPFVVDQYKKPSSGAVVERHAKGGTEKQRAYLNALLKAGNEIALRAALNEFDSPQANVRLSILRRGEPVAAKKEA